MTNSNYAWVRRHSIHSQPQPLSVQGFGYRYRRSWLNMAEFENRRRVSMVAGRSYEDGRTAANLRARKKAVTESNACLELALSRQQQRRSLSGRLSLVLS